MINPIRYSNRVPLVACDTETELFTYGKMAPRVVCYSFAWYQGDELHSLLLDKEEGAVEFHSLMERAARGELAIAMQNGAYDFLVHLAAHLEDWAAVIDVHENAGVHDTMIAEQLIDIARGMLRMQWDEEKLEWKANKSYALGSLSHHYLGWQEYKQDSWRLRYGELIDVPLRDWPQEAVAYPKQDAEGTLRVALAQQQLAREVPPHCPLEADLAAQCRAALALALVSAWGLEVDPVAAREFEARLEEACERLATEEVEGKYGPESLVSAGLLYRHVRGKKFGQLSRKDEPLRLRVADDCAERGVSPDMTEGGEDGSKSKVKANAEALADCKDPLLKQMHEYLQCSKQLTSFAKKLVAAGYGPMHPRYGLADTGRTTCSGGGTRKGSLIALNIQQLPRKNPKALEGLPGVSECFRPRAGHVFSSTDYSALEMVCWAQVQEYLFPGCENPLKDALNADLDPHLLGASQIMGTSYEEALRRLEAKDKETKEWRQLFKAQNFGRLGGMGHKKFCAFAKAQGLRVSEELAKELKENFDRAWKPQNYFRHASAACEGGSATAVQLVSNRIRGGLGYSDFANGFFQGLAADLAKDATWRVVVECYDERKKSILLGSRVVAMIHDDIRCEHPEEIAAECAARVGEIMLETARDWCPAVKTKAEPALMRRMSKAAGDAVYVDGRLVPWEDRPQ